MSQNVSLVMAVKLAQKVEINASTNRIGYRYIYIVAPFSILTSVCQPFRRHTLNVVYIYVCNFRLKVEVPKSDMNCYP